MDEEHSIQVSFQGGGAKIVELLAAAEAIQEKCTSENVRISRVAGTSAGSIVATLVAFDIKISALDSSLFSQILDTVAKAPGIDRLTGDGWLDKGDQLLAIAKGQSFIEEGYLKVIIEKALDVLGVDPDTTIRDVPMPLFIGAASQVSRKAEYFNQESAELAEYRLSDAIVASCKIPFVFTNFKADGDIAHAYVDGGLCENLPVEPLLSEKSKYGPVLAIGIASEADAWPAKNAKQYIGHLFDIAINNSVKRAERFVGTENVHRVVSKVGTTDFLKLQATFRLSDDYRRTFKSCAAWLERRLRALSPSSEATIEIPSQPTVQELLEQNARSFEARRNNRTYRVEYSAMIATPCSWMSRYEVEQNGIGDLDIYSRVHLVPRQADFELYEYPIGMTAIDGSWVVPPTLNVEIVQADGQRRPAKYEIFQYSLEGELFGYRKKMVKCVVVLNEPLPKSTDQISGEQADKLLIWYQQKTETLFADLTDPNEDHDSLGLFATAGINASIEKVYLLVCGDADRAKVNISVDELSCELTEISSISDLPTELAYMCSPEFPFHGWVSGEVVSGKGARLRLENLPDE
ncbi:patatin-like phospholipase family protein [Yoonia maritima]|uniref:patatin-like phospholipase family protein n=1 Tax=Yoonia maritima TaxID=1435347 RepID=UPI003736F8E2